MTKTKLLAGAALALTTGIAMADSNDAIIDQDSSGATFGNTADITQSGSNNRGGADTTYNGDSLRMDQTGGGNVLILDQTGSRNDFAVDGNRADQLNGFGAGFNQTGNNNNATVTQAEDNRVRRLQQIGDANTATLTQDGTYDRSGASRRGANEIGTVVQDSTGAASGNTLTIEQFRNGSSDNGENFVAADRRNGGNQDGFAGGVYQTGSANVGDITQTGSNNGLGELNQDGTGNSAAVDQTGEGTFGRGNEIALIEQDNSNAATSIGNRATVTQQSLTANNGNLIGTVRSVGDDNTINLSQTGDNNGTSAFSTGSMALAAQIASGGTLSQRNAIQVGDGNTIDYLIANNNNNSFGFRQQGDGNMAVATAISGDNNQLAVLQQGDLNMATIEHTGNGNDIGIAQIGNSNASNPIVVGDDNVVGSFQTGDGNMFDLTIDGDRNGGNGSFGTNAAGSLGLTAGLFEQLGNDNTFDGSVTGDDNVLASVQDGNNNDIVGAITGSSNQVAVSQVGNGNFADFTQIGSNNVAGISQ